MMQYYDRAHVTLYITKPGCWLTSWWAPPTATSGSKEKQTNKIDPKIGIKRV